MSGNCEIRLENRLIHAGEGEKSRFQPGICAGIPPWAIPNLFSREGLRVQQGIPVKPFQRGRIRLGPDPGIQVSTTRIRGSGFGPGRRLLGKEENKGIFRWKKNMEKGLGELWSGAGSPKIPTGGIWDLLEEGGGNDMEKLGGGFPGVSPSPRNIPESKTAFPNLGGNPQIQEGIPKSQSSSPNPEHLPRFHNPIPKSIPSSLPVRGPAPGPDPGVPDGPADVFRLGARPGAEPAPAHLLLDQVLDPVVHLQVLGKAGIRDRGWGCPSVLGTGIFGVWENPGRGNGAGEAGKGLGDSCGT